MSLKEYKREFTIINVDTNKNDLDIEKWATNENNVYGYVCKDKQQNVIGTKYFMEHIKIREVTASFRKDIRTKNIRIAA